MDTDEREKIQHRGHRDTGIIVAEKKECWPEGQRYMNGAVELLVEEILGAEGAEPSERGRPGREDGAGRDAAAESVEGGGGAEQGHGFIELEVLRVEFPQGGDDFEPESH